jgi:hypothetical protein
MTRRKRNPDPAQWELGAAMWVTGRVDPIPTHPGALPERIYVSDVLGDGSPDPALVARAADQKWDDCAYYDGCLDLSASENWDQWSCARCPVFKPAIPGETYEVSVRREDPADHLYEINRGGRRGVSSNGD